MSSLNLHYIFCLFAKENLSLLLQQNPLLFLLCVAISICLMSLIKQISIHVESSNEDFIRNTVYFGYSNLC